MGRHKINDDGNWRWFDSDEEYYLFRRARDQFDSAEEYDRLRAFFSSDGQLLLYLRRRNDNGYQCWLEHHGGSRSDSEELYQAYLVRANDNAYQCWLDLYWRDFAPNDSPFHHEFDEWYGQFLEERSQFNGTDKDYEEYLYREISKRNEAEEQERQQRLRKKQNRARIIIDTICGVIIFLVMVIGVTKHWKLLGFVLVLAPILLIRWRVMKRVMDNIYYNIY